LTNFTGAISGLVTDVLNGTNVTNLFNSTGLSNPSQSIAAVNNLTNTTGLPSPSEAIAALNNLTNSTGLPSPSEAIAALNNFTNLNLTNLTSLASDLLNSTTLSPESLLDQLNSTLPSSSEALAALANLTNDPSAAITSLSATVANLTTIISGAVSSVPPLPAISVSGSGSSASASNASGSSSPSPSPSPSAFASRTGSYTFSIVMSGTVESFSSAKQSAVKSHMASYMQISSSRINLLTIEAASVRTTFRLDGLSATEEQTAIDLFRSECSRAAPAYGMLCRTLSVYDSSGQAASSDDDGGNGSGVFLIILIVVILGGCCCMGFAFIMYRNHKLKKQGLTGSSRCLGGEHVDGVPAECVELGNDARPSFGKAEAPSNTPSALLLLDLHGGEDLENPLECEASHVDGGYGENLAVCPPKELDSDPEDRSIRIEPYTAYEPAIEPYSPRQLDSSRSHVGAM
jgi:hypothetical protein